MPMALICVRFFLGFLYHETQFPVPSTREKNPTSDVHYQQLKSKQKLSNRFHIAMDLKGNMWQINCEPMKTESKTHSLSVMAFPWPRRIKPK